VIEVPLVAESGKYWIDNGPLFVANRNPLITYRVISKDELEFSGAEKSVYEFFESSFSDPEGIAKCDFETLEKQRQELLCVLESGCYRNAHKVPSSFNGALS